MKLLKVTGLTVDEPIILDVYSDTHFPTKQEELLQKHIDQTKEDGAYWVHLGDWCEAIMPTDRRFSIEADGPPILEAYNKAVRLYRPIADQCIAVLSGNHDETIGRLLGNPVKNIIAEHLKVPYLGDMGFIDLKMNGYPIPIHIWHGWFGGELRGAKANRLHRQSHKYLARLYLAGHWHTYDPFEDHVLYSWNGEVQRQPRTYIACPSYYDTYNTQSNYASSRAFYPTVIGCVRIEISEDNITYQLLR